MEHGVDYPKSQRRRPTASQNKRRETAQYKSEESEEDVHQMPPALASSDKHTIVELPEEAPKPRRQRGKEPRAAIAESTAQDSLYPHEPPSETNTPREDQTPRTHRHEIPPASKQHTLAADTLTHKALKARERAPAAEPMDTKSIHRSPPMNAPPSLAFYVILTGQIESCNFPEHDSLYCKYSFVYGADWTWISGPEYGISQVATKSIRTDATSTVTWNMPLEITFKSTNVYGWPQLADMAARTYPSILAGLHHCNFFLLQSEEHVGTNNIVRYTKYIRLFTPKPTRLLEKFTAPFTGQYTEFSDSKFVCRSEGRQVARVSSNGLLKVVFNVQTKGMSKFGYSDTPNKIS